MLICICKYISKHTYKQISTSLLSHLLFKLCASDSATASRIHEASATTISTDASGRMPSHQIGQMQEDHSKPQNRLGVFPIFYQHQHHQHTNSLTLQTISSFSLLLLSENQKHLKYRSFMGHHFQLVRSWILRRRLGRFCLVLLWTLSLSSAKLQNFYSCGFCSCPCKCVL